MLITKYYQTEGGGQPVKAFINSLPSEVQTKIRKRLFFLCSRFPDTQGLDTKHLRGKLWELRIEYMGNQYRIIFSILIGKMVILHGFMKKQRRAQHEIEIASKRLSDYIQRLKK